jgi:hypothetical protein
MNCEVTAADSWASLTVFGQLQNWAGVETQYRTTDVRIILSDVAAVINSLDEKR